LGIGLIPGDFHGLEEEFAEVADLFAAEEGFLGGEDVANEGLVGLLALLVRQVAEEEVVVEVVQLIPLRLSLQRGFSHFHSLLLRLFTLPLSPNVFLKILQAFFLEGEGEVVDGFVVLL
jgi:hypothetical protein